MQNLLDGLSGKKTYLAVAAGGLMLFGSWNHWWVIDPSVYTALTLAALGFLRAGVDKGTAPPVNPPIVPPNPKP